MKQAKMVVVQMWITTFAFLVVVIGKSTETTLIGVGVGVCSGIATLLTMHSTKRALARQGKKVSRNPFRLP
ncbi:hypothetical protein [Streptomyces sp. MAR4 CNX-425]|uniref:hypothetical protein n=1 Tax=Streptomyces sp. MAR4 CNX-425 TaxID=3406343 RepID=UPI003B5100DF